MNRLFILKQFDLRKGIFFCLGAEFTFWDDRLFINF